MAAVHSPGRGLRRFDEHAAKATKLVDDFRGLDTGMAPSHALAALKRAAPYMDVPLRVVSVIDLLFAWTKPQDWQSGRIPVVWPSNDLLAQKLGVTVRQVQKLLKQAQAFGLIGFVDSPNGHRGGRRGGVVDFIDEWISAPYAIQRDDRTVVLAGLAWMKEESARRFAKPVPDLDTAQLHAICDDICYLPRAKPSLAKAATFFARSSTVEKSPCTIVVPASASAHARRFGSSRKFGLS